MDGSDYVDYEYGEEGEADRQDLGLVGIFGVRSKLVIFFSTVISTIFHSLEASDSLPWELYLPRQCLEL